MKKLSTYLLSVNLFFCIPLSIGVFIFEEKERSKVELLQKQLVEVIHNQNILAQGELYILNNKNLDSINSLKPGDEIPTVSGGVEYR